MNDLLCRLWRSPDVINVPAEGLEERIEELAAGLGLVVLAGFVGFESCSRRAASSRISHGAGMAGSF